MKKYLLIENEVILSVFNENLSEDLIEVDVDDNCQIHVGFDKYIKGKIVHKNKDYERSVSIETAIIQIHKLKTNLSDTDYKIIKRTEGLLSDEEYQSILSERAEWRKQINELENIINGGN